MKKVLLGLATCVVAASLPAQMDAGPFVRTFSSTLTRGYFFQVPPKITSMIVTHVQVPDEAKTAGAKQIVAIYKLSASPRSGPSVKPVFFSSGVNPGQRIPVVDQTNNNKPLIFNGSNNSNSEWFVVMGCMGQSTGTVDNSYGNSNIASSVLGMPVTLQRCGIQANIAVAKGVGTMFGSTSGSIARVHIWVAGHASAEQYGVGSSTTPGMLDYLAPPSIGKTASMTFRPGATNTGGILAIGLIRANLPLPFGNVLITPVLVLQPVPGGPLPTAGATISYKVPNNSSLQGFKVVFQGAEGRSGGNIFLTNGMEWQIGK